MFRNRIVIMLLLALCYLLSSGSNTEAYKENTHRGLSNKAIQYSCLQDADYLESIGINSKSEVFNSKRFDQWIELGADEEDSGIRSRHHFHNPLQQQWTDAGLNNFVLGQSSLLRAQDASNEFSWQNARQYFHDAFTSSSAESRETGFANVFETLGHLIHLVQDCACPPHTRNDAHVLVASGYEGWALNYPDDVLNYASPFKAAVDLDVSVEGYEPITQFFDTNQYAGFTPSTSNTQGLAEYSNANFASEDTIFTENLFPDHIHHFPFPRKADTEEYEQDMGGKVRTYFRKVQNGETIEHFAVADRFYRYLPWWPEVQVYFIGFDKLCHADYAQKLIPRAVGYSAALLDYFFRGDMDLIENPINPDGYVIENKTDEKMVGTFELYYDNENEERVKVPNQNGGFPVQALISAGGKSGNIDFTAPDDLKEPGKYILVFRGQMGSETDAVVGTLADVNEFSRIVFKAGDYYAVWDITSGEVTLEPTNNSDDYDPYVPSPFVSNESCRTEPYYSKQTLEHSLECVQTQVHTTTHLYLECPSSTMDWDAPESATTTRHCEGTNEFGMSASDYLGVLTSAYNPFCNEGGDPDAGGESSGSYSESWVYYDGYRLTCNNGSSDQKTAVITESAIASWGSGSYICTRSYSISDPCGDGSYSDAGCSDPVEYKINGYGFYNVDEEGNPINGAIVTWIIQKLEGVCSVYATSDSNVPGDTGANSLSSSETLASMLESLINQGGESISYIR